MKLLKIMFGAILIVVIVASIWILFTESGTAFVEQLQNDGMHNRGMNWIIITTFCFLFMAVICILADAAKNKSEKERKHRAAYARSIRKTKLIHISNDSTAHTAKDGVIGRALIGDLIAGPVGGIIGAATARSRTTIESGPQKAMFMVYFKDGNRMRDTVEEGTWEYDLYMDKLDLDDEPKRVIVQDVLEPEEIDDFEVYEEFEEYEEVEEYDDDDEIGELPEKLTIQLPEPRHDDAQDLDILAELQRAYRNGIIDSDEYMAKRKKLLEK